MYNLLYCCPAWLSVLLKALSAARQEGRSAAGLYNWTTTWTHTLTWVLQWKHQTSLSIYKSYRRGLKIIFLIGRQGVLTLAICFLILYTRTHFMLWFRKSMNQGNKSTWQINIPKTIVLFSDKMEIYGPTLETKVAAHIDSQRLLCDGCHFQS